MAPRPMAWPGNTQTGTRARDAASHNAHLRLIPLVRESESERERERERETVCQYGRGIKEHQEEGA